MTNTSTFSKSNSKNIIAWILISAVTFTMMGGIIYLLVDGFNWNNEVRAF